VKKGTYGFNLPDGIIAPRLSDDLGELIAVVGLPGGSRVTGGLSARGRANAPVGDWSDDFTLVVGDHRHRCRSSVAQFVSPRVSKLQWIDATISELRLEVEDGDEFLGSVLEVAKGGDIAVDSAHRRRFEGICAALRNSKLYRCVYLEVWGEVAMENVVDRLQFSSANGSDISTELEFIASHFCDLLCRPEICRPCFCQPFTRLSAKGL
jgi:hypothetical protein